MSTRMIAIAKTTEAAVSTMLDFIHQVKVSNAVYETGAFPLAATIRLIGTVSGSEYVKLEYHDGDTWRDVVVAGETQILNADNSVRTLYGRMIDVRLSKSATTNAVGVEVI